MKRFFATLIVVGACLMSWKLVQHSHYFKTVVSSENNPPKKLENSFDSQASQSWGFQALSYDSASLPLPESTIDVIAGAMESYWLLVRTTGKRAMLENRDWTALLTGDNPHQLKIIDPDSKSINDNGELVDAWNTPFHFHFESVRDVRVRSAGRDRVMWTNDDITSTNYQEDITSTNYQEDTI